MVSGNSITSVLTLPGSWTSVFIQVPTMSVGFNADTSIFVLASADGTTFRRYGVVSVNTSSVQYNDFQILSAASLKMINIPGFSFNYMKLETTAVATAGVSAMSPFTIICTPNQ
jgi:hypothetical protein